MAEAVRIVGHWSDRDSNEMLQAQVDPLGNLHTREGAYPGLCKTYEGTLTVGVSPLTCDFYADTGRYASDGYIMCDGTGSISVDYSRDGITFSDKFTIKDGEQVSLLRLDIMKLRLTHSGTDSGYRILLI